VGRILSQYHPTNIPIDKCEYCVSIFFFLLLFFFFHALNFLVESFGLLNDLFPFLSILDAGYPVFDLHLADVLCDVILQSVLGSSL